MTPSRDNGGKNLAAGSLCVAGESSSTPRGGGGGGGPRGGWHDSGARGEERGGEGGAGQEGRGRGREGNEGRLLEILSSATITTFTRRFKRYTI